MSTTTEVHQPPHLSAEPLTDLNTVITELKEAYVEERRKSDPEYSLPRYLLSNSFWREAAEQVISRGADPYPFVRALFVLWPNNSLPLPEVLASPRAVAAHEDWNGASGSEEIHRFRFHEGVLSDEVGKLNRDKDDVLSGQSWNFSPVFRIAHSSDGKLPEMIERYRAAAINQLSHDRPLLRYFLDRFPDRAAILLDELDGPDAADCQG